MFKVIAIFATIFMVACSYSKMEYGSQGVFKNVDGPQALEVQVLWLKNKKDAVDMNVKFMNSYKFPIVIKLSDLNFEMEGEKAYLRNSEVGWFEIPPEGRTERLIVFRFDKQKDRAGVGKFTIGNILEGPIENLGKTKIKPMAMELPVKARE